VPSFPPSLPEKRAVFGLFPPLSSSCVVLRPISWRAPHLQLLKRTSLTLLSRTCISFFSACSPFFTFEQEFRLPSCHAVLLFRRLKIFPSVGSPLFSLESSGGAEFPLSLLGCLLSFGWIRICLLLNYKNPFAFFPRLKY